MFPDEFNIETGVGADKAFVFSVNPHRLSEVSMAESEGEKKNENQETVCLLFFISVDLMCLAAPALSMCISDCSLKNSAFLLLFLFPPIQMGIALSLSWD